MRLGPRSATPHAAVAQAMHHCVSPDAANCLLVDLGCNDGRVLLHARASSRAAYAVGIDTDWDACCSTLQAAGAYNGNSTDTNCSIEVVCGDALSCIRWHLASVVWAYALPTSMHI